MTWSKALVPSYSSTSYIVDIADEKELNGLGAMQNKCKMEYQMNTKRRNDYFVTNSKRMRGACDLGKNNADQRSL